MKLNDFVSTSPFFSLQFTLNYGIKDGMKVEEAMNIKPKDIADYLGGLPARKFHCSILADKAFKKAVENYRNKK